jgi:hypothetical protein
MFLTSGARSGGLELRVFIRSVGPISDAPSGHGSLNAYPGLKPWAILYNRFAVKSVFPLAPSPFRPFAVSPYRPYLR